MSLIRVTFDNSEEKTDFLKKLYDDHWQDDVSMNTLNNGSKYFVKKHKYGTLCCKIIDNELVIAMGADASDIKPEYANFDSINYIDKLLESYLENEDGSLNCKSITF